MTRGRLLALEGLDGCGKSTQCEAIVAALRGAGVDIVVTREPTAGAWGRRIRAMARGGETVAPEEELRWFVADRREHVARVVEPALAAGRSVVTDRYFLSTVAYQGARGQGARGLDWRTLLADSEAEFPLPDLVLLFEIEPEAGLARVRARAGTAEPAFEHAGFLARVAEIFAAIDRGYIARIDAAGTPDEVRAEALARLADRWSLSL